MAKKPTKADSPAAPAYEDDAMYRVQLARPVTIGRTTYSPARPTQMKGRVLATLAPEDVLDAAVV